MRFRKDRHEMVEGEVNKVELDLRPIAGANNVTSVTYSNSALTFEDEAISGTDASMFVSGGTAGRDYIVTVTAELSSGETKVGAFLLKWKAPGYDDIAGVV